MMEFAMKKLALVAAIAATALPATAAEMRVRDLDHLCRTDVARCHARILGEVDGVAAGQRLLVDYGHAQPKFCMPRAAGPEEKVRVVKSYMREHPETMSHNAGWMIAWAITYAYPCPHKR